MLHHVRITCSKQYVRNSMYLQNPTMLESSSKLPWPAEEMSPCPLSVTIEVKNQGEFSGYIFTRFSYAANTNNKDLNRGSLFTLTNIYYLQYVIALPQLHCYSATIVALYIATPVGLISAEKLSFGPTVLTTSFSNRFCHM